MSFHRFCDNHKLVRTFLVLVATLTLSIGLKPPDGRAAIEDVPGESSTIDLAISVLAAGDTIQFSEDYFQGSFTVTKKLVIENPGGHDIDITATATVSADEVEMKGITFEKGILMEGNDLLVEDCSITGDYASVPQAGVVVEGTGLTVRGVTFDGNNYGIIGNSLISQGCSPCCFLLVDDLTVEDCVFKDVTSAIRLGCPRFGGGQGGSGTIRNSVFDNCSVVLWDTYDEANTTFENNIVVNCTDVFPDECPGTFQYNVFNGNTDDSCTLGSNNSSDDPLFCGSQEGTSEYTLRMDSPAVAGNNTWSEDIGPFGVECAFGTLARDTEVAEGVEVLVLEDVTVPSGKTLTIGSNAKFSFDEDDDSSGGNDTSENELIISGTLDVNGTSGNEVEFISAVTSPAEAEWYGLRVTAGTTNIDNAIIKNAENGLSISGGSTYIDSVSFSSNLSYDVIIQSTSVDTSEITNCTLTVFTGSGIRVASDDVLIMDNTIACADTTNFGIEIVNDASNVLHPQIIGNTIKDFTNGSGIYVPAESPNIEKNTIKDGKWGIYLTGGAAKIGDSSDNSSDNTITGNTRGIYSNCAGPGSCPTCSGFAPVVRENNISSNTTGVYVSKRGFIDLGNATQNGDNTFTNNTAYCIRNVANCDTVSAVGNWFGAHPPIVCWGGDIDVTGPLTTAPASFRDIGIERQDGPVGPLAVQALWPNPVRTSATLQFRTTEAVQEVEMQIFDVAGRLVWSDQHTTRAAGVHEFVWDGTNEQGKQVTDGIYFVRLTADGAFHQNTRLMVVR
ncbi:MAG: T9SS type A sorting domain-containing protein [Candidatus Eisenbacteria bacterium]|uniref:T9SS type A sorting domain-containing protein n=1 Tax=Eiseniibacteriota bacterium TaxID=2212470 RepID=A0A7Y2EC02_UNCEI|nr:T9SS type A sorting domain-containing protein [Candidatus Eisenbacteria bacterium]